MRLSNQYQIIRVAASSEEVPPEPGSTPIPPDHVRLYHFTHGSGGEYNEEQIVESLRKSGIDISQARGETYGEPNVVWASTRLPRQHKLFAEFSVHKDDPRWDIGKPTRPGDVEHLHRAGSDVTFTESIRPEEIIAVHAPWHQAYRDLTEDSDSISKVLAGDYDYLLDNPRWADEAKAVQYIKEKHGENEVSP